MKHRIWILTLLIFLITSHQGWAQSDSASWVCPKGFEGQTLRFFNWADYVAEDTISNFEAACGVTVDDVFYSSNRHMLRQMQAATEVYDVVVARDYIVASLIEKGLIQPLDFSRIPNAANLNPAFAERFFDPTGAYSMPYQWGTIGIGYNRTLFEEGAITSWADFFGYTGPVGWIDDYRAMLGIALIMNGYDPNSTDTLGIATAAHWLLEQNKDENGYLMVKEITATAMRPLIMEGVVDMGIGYGGDMLRMNVDCECEDYGYIIPEEGTNLWMDNLVIPSNSGNVALAHAFIDYIMDAQVGADLTSWVLYATPNLAAQALLDEATRTNPVIYPDEAILEKSFFNAYLGEDNTLFINAWVWLVETLFH